MVQVGYALSSEEHTPLDLVRNARRAEETGFTFALISDHYHPWIDRQGNSPNVWGVLGGIALATERLVVGSGVTCPIMRHHPALVAQAAATQAAMMPGRFFLGVGTGENLNEHILGDHWPPAMVRQAMLEEAIHIIRLLWQGDWVEFYGEHFTVENARLYTLPDRPPQIMIASSGSSSAELAGRIGDGLITTAPNAELVKTFKGAGGAGKPCYGQVQACWAESEAEARRISHEWWPTAGLGGELGQELRLPQYFEQASKNVTVDEATQGCACGPDPDAHIAAIRQFLDAGFDHVYVHQVGPDQEGFFRFYEKEVLPKLQRTRQVNEA